MLLQHVKIVRKMGNLILITICFFLIGKGYSQNTISVRKTDTSFNAIFYSDNVFRHKSYTSLKGNEKQNKKVRMYYVFGVDGQIWFFMETHKQNKIIKSCKNIDWDNISPTGKYFIRNKELVIYPYHRSMTGEQVLNEVYFDGVYNKKEMLIYQNGNRKKLLFLCDY